MLAEHLTGLIYKELGHPPTKGQDALIKRLSEFVTDSNSSRMLILKGYAGTGKTTAIGAFVKTLDRLEIKNVLMAPTGRAAKVFSGYAGKNANTIHRKIYIKKSSKDAFGRFVLGTNLHRNTIFLVDEASMISNLKPADSVFGSGRLLDDLVHYVKGGHNCGLVLIGDTAQLPPVGTTLSPALETGDMEAYYSRISDLTLTEVVRQASDSGILVNATIIRNIISSGKAEIPILRHRNLPGVELLPSADLAASIEKSYSEYGIEDTVIICRSNKRANQFNNGIRRQVLYREEDLAKGDMLMVVRNNYFWLAEDSGYDFIANGDIVKIIKILRYDDRHEFRFAFVKLLLIDYNIEFESWIMLDTLISESASLTENEYMKLYNNVMADYPDCKSRKEQAEAVHEDPFFNALQVKYAYAVTCHKAQGGQWKAVFIDQGYIKKEMIDRDYLRWLYTAITRATEKLYLVNFPDYFLEK
jgi:exodeoxyribonuclease V